jgi:hypothetical protein
VLRVQLETLSKKFFLTNIFQIDIEIIMFLKTSILLAVVLVAVLARPQVSSMLCVVEVLVSIIKIILGNDYAKFGRCNSGGFSIKLVDLSAIITDFLMTLLNRSKLS